MKYSVLIGCSLGLLLLSVTTAGANDSVGRLAAGGIIFENTPDIEMASELLEISVSEIKVSYLFRNHADNDIKKTILFPLPLKHLDDELRNISPFYAGSFFVAVNGQRVKTRLIQRAVLHGQDITQRLQGLGLADAMIFNYEGCEIDAELQCSLTKEQLSGLKRLGLNGGELWPVQEVIAWEQVFPAHSEITVSHFYTPSVGGTFYYFPAEAGGGEGGWDVFKKANADVCIDESTLRVVERHMDILLKSGVSIVREYVADVEYILLTGKNWRGPIGDFRLRVKKSLPEEVVSLCFPGKPVKKDALTYEFHQKNFVPEGDVVVKFFYFNAEN